MRLFFALPVAARLQLDIDHWCTTKLAQFSQRIPPQNYHITLAFLGDVNAAQQEKLLMLADESLEQKSFSQRSLLIDQTGYWAKPGILWIGPSSWPDELNRLAKSLAACGNSIGVKSSKKPFQPHISLLRNCADPSLPLSAPEFTLPYSSIVLYQSETIRGGVRYSSVAEWQLASSPAVPTAGISKAERHLRKRPVLRKK